MTVNLIDIYGSTLKTKTKKKKQFKSDPIIKTALRANYNTAIIIFFMGEILLKNRAL